MVITELGKTVMEYGLGGLHDQKKTINHDPGSRAANRMEKQGFQIVRREMIF